MWSGYVAVADRWGAVAFVLEKLSTPFAANRAEQGADVITHALSLVGATDTVTNTHEEAPSSRSQVRSRCTVAHVLFAARELLLGERLALVPRCSVHTPVDTAESGGMASSRVRRAGRRSTRGCSRWGYCGARLRLGPARRGPANGGQPAMRARS